MIRVGTCAWADHEKFYPAGMKPTDRLEYYSRFFNLVEVDSTYYAIQPARNFARWAERTPDEFAFNVKAYRELTFHDRVEPKQATFDAFRESLIPVKEAGKLRAVLFQFPPWFTAGESNAEYLKSLPERMPDELVAVEFRHVSWLEKERRDWTLHLLRDSGLAYSMVDAPQIGSGTSPKVVDVTSPEVAIVRLHGRNKQSWYKPVATTAERFNYHYSMPELAEWLPDVQWMDERTNEVHLLMNNNMSNYAITNARDLQLLLNLPRPNFPDQQQLPLGDLT